MMMTMVMMIIIIIAIISLVSGQKTAVARQKVVSIGVFSLSKCVTGYILFFFFGLLFWIYKSV